MSHPYGWLSLLPPLVAIGLAIATRRVVLSLLAGICMGALITSHGDPATALAHLLELHLWKSLANEDRLRVFAFTLLMGAMVGVIHRCGGMRGLVDAVAPLATTRRSGQLATWTLGLLVFFDDYANTVLLGHTLRPLCDRLRISREKLAYVVDSTAAPVSGLALVSTWVAAEIGFIQEGLNNLGTPVDVTAFELFLRSIPYRFYVLWALCCVFLVGWMQRDFGPMLRAERQTLRQKPPGDRPISESDVHDEVTPSGWWNAVIPIAVTVLAVLWLLYATGRAAVDDAVEAPTLWQIFGEADSYYALLWGALAGLLAAAILSWAQRLLDWPAIGGAMGRGAQLVMPALIVLWLASALSAMTGSKPLDGDSPYVPTQTTAYRLYTGEYLAGLVQNGQDEPGSPELQHWLPTLIFLLAAGTSFATGTSWGTMAIIMPVAIPLAYGATQGAGAEWGQDPALLATVGSVLAGSIFGDHCSPISDTTVLSSQSCGCDHAAHVRTQLPYAVTVGGVSVLLGTLPIGYGVSVWLLLPAGIIAMIVLFRLLGSPADTELG